MAEAVVLCAANEVADGETKQAPRPDGTKVALTFDVTTGEPPGMLCEIPLKTGPIAIVDAQVQIEV